MSKTVGIYKIENLVNGHVYIGQSVNIEKRWVKHKWDLNNSRHINSHLQHAWNKYGEDNFTHEIIEACEVEELDDKEKLWIDFYDATNQLKGYNISSGGQGSHNMADETKAKLRLINTGKVLSQESRELVSESHKGRKCTDEQKLHMSLAQKSSYALKHPDTWYKNKTNPRQMKRVGENVPSATHTDDEIRNVIQLLLNNKSNFEISEETGVEFYLVSKIRHKGAWSHLTEGLNFPYVRQNKYAETNNQILEDIKGGIGRHEIVAKYNISTAKFYILKNSLKEVS